MSEAVYRAMSGRTSGPERELRGMSVADLARTVRGGGTKRAAAAALGVTPKTFARWESGAVKSPRGLAGLTKAARSTLRRARLGPRKEAKLRRGAPGLTVTGEFKVSSPGKRGDDVRRRTVKLGNVLPTGALSPVVDAYLAGDDAGAAAAMALAIGGRGESYDEPEGALPGATLGDLDGIDLR